MWIIVLVDKVRIRLVRVAVNAVSEGALPEVDFSHVKYGVIKLILS